MRNLEAKFDCDDHSAILSRALEMGASDAGIIEQVDTFFRVPTGRLKLRVEEGRATLIAYMRGDSPEARESEYFVYSTDCPDELLAVLSVSLDAGPVVVKQRHLLLFAHTRIHLDDVAGLGRFVEVETVLDDEVGWDPRQEHLAVVDDLGLDGSGYGRVSVAYADMLAARWSG